MSFNSQKRSSGFVAIAALFILVLLGAISGAIVFLSTTQQVNSGKDAMGSKAYWAARSGMEWGITKVNASSACTGLPSTMTIDGFTVDVSCTVSSFTEAGAPVKILTITSTAQQGSSGGIRIERKVSGSLEK